jgi:hypothetical protein
MTKELVTYLAQYRGRHLLLDANLLLVLAIGMHDPIFIERHKRTKGEYRPSDFELIVDLIDFFGNTLSTPSVLTEVSNLLPQGGLPEGMKRSLLGRFAEVVRFLEERYMPSGELSTHDQFVVFGLTDIAVLEAAVARNCLIVTADARFASFLYANGIDAVSFNCCEN